MPVAAPPAPTIPEPEPVEPSASQVEEFEGLRAVAKMLEEASESESERRLASEGVKAANELETAIRAGRVSASAAESISQLAGAVQEYDFARALHVHGLLVSTEWGTLREFLKASKHFLTAAKKKMSMAEA
jgi:hypothetical protein